MPPRPGLFSLDNLLKQAQVTPASVVEPKHAKTVYKLVARPDRSGRVNSLFANVEYELQRSYQQVTASEAEGGLLGFGSPIDAVLRENLTVLSSNEHPVLIAVVRAWNLDARSIPRKYGAKLAYDYFCIVGLQEVPPSQQPTLQEAASGGPRRAATEPSWMASVYRPPSSRREGAAAVGLEQEPSMTPAQHETRSMAASVAALEASLREHTPLGLASSTASARRPCSQVEPVAHRPPPTYAATLYALVRAGSPDQLLSLHDPGVAYKIGTTYRQVDVACQDGALHGFASVRAAVAQEPPALLHGRGAPPLAVAELRAWNLGMRGPLSTQHAHKRVALDFVRAVRLLEVSPELAQTLPGAELWRRHE